ncbi:hypothetical protein P3T76_005981 [Phytophthora citrophthora]|uniref:Uncharacterized protein n=1 Tax=Phytophthora citrophthora TaxID=4793 RepID=A0AAD9GPS6_9STRA|nr:hypothetical protein P3T76_005981 [Phytophthora citrophthora]
MLVGTALSSLIAFATFSSYTEAHGYLEQPKPSWKDGPNVNWVTLVDNYWDIGSGGDQVGKFKTMAKEKGMSVKDVVLDMVKDQKCGNTLADGAAQPIPSDGKVKWLGNNGGGFTHTGPCEIYLDDKMVLHGDDCEDEFQGGDVGSKQTSDMTVDFSSCNGKCLLTIYWLAFQNAQWQTYGMFISLFFVVEFLGRLLITYVFLFAVNCVPLEGSGGGGASTSTTQGSSTDAGSGKSETEQKATDAPSTEQQIEAPSTGSKSTGDSSNEQQVSEASSTGEKTPEAPAVETPEAPAAETPEAPAAETPAATTQATQAPSTPEAPATEDTKCKAPGRRLRKKQASA